MIDAPRAYILAGGKSSRFGSDKARALLDGQPLLTRIASTLRNLNLDVTVVADRPDKYADLGLPTIADQFPEIGPLGGLHAALVDATLHHADWIILLSCDLIELQPGWISQLIDQRTPDASFVAFHHEGWEPLLACYHTSLKMQVEEQIRHTQYAMFRLLEKARGIRLQTPPDWPSHFQVNTPGELLQAQMRLHGRNDSTFE